MLSKHQRKADANFSRITKHTLNKLTTDKLSFFCFLLLLFLSASVEHKKKLSNSSLGACGIVFGHPFDTVKTWQQVYKTSELIKKFQFRQLFGFIMICFIIRYRIHQVTHSNHNGLKLWEKTMLFKLFPRWIMNHVE